MWNFNPTQHRDAHGRWTADVSLEAIKGLLEKVGRVEFPDGSRAVKTIDGKVRVDTHEGSHVLVPSRNPEPMAKHVHLYQAANKLLDASASSTHPESLGGKKTFSSWREYEKSTGGQSPKFGDKAAREVIKAAAAKAVEEGMAKTGPSEAPGPEKPKEPKLHQFDPGAATRGKNGGVWSGENAGLEGRYDLIEYVRKMEAADKIQIPGSGIATKLDDNKAAHEPKFSYNGKEYNRHGLGRAMMDDSARSTHPESLGGEKSYEGEAAHDAAQPKAKAKAAKERKLAAQSYKRLQSSKRLWERHFAKLSPEHELAVEQFHGSDYEDLNAELRGTKPSTTYISNIAKQLDAAIAASPATTKVETVYRGLQDAKFKKLRPGEVLTDYGFPAVADNKKMAAGFGSAVVLQITVPPGTHLASISPDGVDEEMGAAGGDNPESFKGEMVMPRGVQLKVDKIVGNTVYVTLQRTGVKREPNKPTSQKKIGE